MKTLHFTNSWHPTSGGIATFYRALLQAADARRQDIRLIVPGETDRVESVAEFAKIYYVRAPRSPFNTEYRTLYPAQFFASSSPIQKILAEERPDVVEICDKYTLNYLGALLRRRLLRGVNFRPMVVGLTCERMDDNFRAYIGRLPGARQLCAAYIKWLYFPFFDHHIAVSDYTADELHTGATGHMVTRNIWIRPMGVDLRRFSPKRKSPEAERRLRQQLGASHDAAIFVYVGRLAPEKNLPLLFDAFARLRDSATGDYRLVVAGDGIEQSHWRHFCAVRAPGRVSFLGHVKNPDDLAELLANADALIHPNPHEPFGIAPLEAMASGLPVVVSNSGGVCSYANGENAWLAAPDPLHFAEAIEALLRDPAESQRRARNALQTAATFSWENTAASFLDLYAALHATAAGTCDSGLTLPTPAFTSTSAEGLRLALSRGALRSAEKVFRFVSAVDAVLRSAGGKSGAGTDFLQGRK